MVATDGSTSKWPTEDQSFVRSATELLKAGEYERLAELLNSARAACDQDRDAIPAQTLDLARRICLACGQSQDEAKWHQQARDEAARREDQLRGQLDALLHLNGVGGKSATAPDLSASVEPPSLWHRLQGLIVRRADAQPAEAVISAVPVQPVEAPVPPPQQLEHRGTPTLCAEPQQEDEPGPPSLVIHCLGPFRVYINLSLIEKWPGLKCKSILKYMIFHRRSPTRREVLVDLFWPDAEEDAGCRNLYQAIYNLRQALKAGDDRFPYILCRDNCYELNPDIDLWIDSEELQSHHASGRKLEREGHLQEAVTAYELAESLYEGEFLAEDRYEDWPVLERENLKHTYLDVLDRLSRFYFEQAHYNMCIAFCQKILAEDNCREDIHRRLMRCFVDCDQLHLAIRQYHVCVETLKRELDVPPMPATVQLYQQLRSTRVQI